MSNSDLKEKLSSPLDFLKNELAQIRTGRVTITLLDRIKVNAYDSDLSVKEVGTISVLDSHTLQISPWDKNLIEAIVFAVKNSDLNLNPSVRGDSVLVPVPTLTEERRKEFTRLVSTKVEEVKNSMRNIRQDAMKDIDAGFENKELGEDEKFSKKKEIEEIVKEFVFDAEKLGEDKKNEILKV